MLKVGCKIWLDNGGKAFGKGPDELLRLVERTESLHEAAHRMGMSYSKAWKLIQMTEKRLGFPLLDKQVGGQSGGGSKVTSRAKDFMRRYERFERDSAKAVEKAYRKHFGHG